MDVLSDRQITMNQNRWSYMKCARLNSTFIIFGVVKMEFKNSHYGGFFVIISNKCPTMSGRYGTDYCKSYGILQI